MAKEREIAIIIKAKDAASSTLGKLGDVATHALGVLAGNLATQAINKIGELGRALTDSLINEAPKLDQVRRSFENLATAAGESADEILASMREAADGMVSDADLMKSYNEAMLLVGESMADKFPELLKIAQASAAATGEDVGFLLDSLVKGIGRASPMILDNLGLTINLSEAYQQYADSLGISTDEMTKAQQQEALLNAVVASGAGFIERLGDNTSGAAATLAQLRTTMTNLKNNVTMALLPALQAILEPLAGLAQEYGPLVQEWAMEAAAWLGEKLPEAIQIAADYWSSTLQPALMNVWQYVQNNVFPILAMLAGWLQEHIPVAISFLMEHWDALKGALIAIGAVLAGAGIITTIASIAGAIAALVNPVTLVIAAVALLGAAWAEDWGGIRTAVTAAYEEHIRPALEQLRAWLAVQVPKAMAKLKSFWESTLQPALQALWGFIRDRVIPVIATWVGWLIENIPTAFETVAAFWNDTLYPALQALWGFIRDRVIPIIARWVQWLSENIPVAFQAVAAFWNDTLYPALQALWDFISNTVIPIISNLVTWLAEKLTSAYSTVKEFWDTVLHPTLQALWSFLQEDVIPLVGAFIDVLKAIGEKGMEAVRGAWQNILSPALTALRDFIRDHVSPRVDALTGVLRTLGGYVNETLGPILSRLKSEFLDRLSSAFDGLKNAVQWVIDKLHTLADAISNINLPSWLVPGSPTPFEEGLRGIADALREVQALSETAFGAPRIAAAGVGAAAAGGTQATVIVQGPLIEHLVVAPGGLRPEQAAAQVAEELGKLLRSR